MKKEGDRMAQTSSWAFGIDLGGTKIIVAAVTAEGVLEQRIQLRTDVRGGPAAVTSEIITAASDLKKYYDTPPVGVGVGVAGQVDEERGIVRFAPNLGWRDLPFGSALGAALDLPVMIMNDVRAATWGEWLHGSGRGCDDLICLFAGTGVGGGVVTGGRMITGCTNTAGEIGHLTVDLHGPPCTCRNSGCVEAIAGGWAIARSAQEAIRSDRAAGAYLLGQAGGDVSAVSAKIVGQSARDGDPLARRLMDDAARALSAGAVSLVNAFNPCRLILGGGVIEGMPELVNRIREDVNRSALLTAIGKLEVLPAELHNDAGVIGMAAYALRTAEDKRKRSAA
jgi:glucokinase